MATTVYLQLDAQYDPVFDPAQEYVDIAAVQQAVLTRLRLFMGEWWENLSLGLPVFQSMLGALGTQRSQQAMRLAIQQQIEGVQYVTKVLNVTSQFNDVTGVFSFSAQYQTAFGIAVTTIAPGSSASLDS